MHNQNFQTHLRNNMLTNEQKTKTHRFLDDISRSTYLYDNQKCAIKLSLFTFYLFVKQQ